jgi:hypothetical protein
MRTLTFRWRIIEKRILDLYLLYIIWRHDENSDVSMTYFWKTHLGFILVTSMYTKLKSYQCCLWCFNVLLSKSTFCIYTCYQYIYKLVILHTILSFHNELKILLVRIHSSGTVLRKMYPRDLITVQWRPLYVRPRGGSHPPGGGVRIAQESIYTE